MYCLPLDDACQMGRFQHDVVVEAVETAFKNERFFLLGAFNGRRYYYALFDTGSGIKPVIMITEDDKSDSYNAAYADVLGGD
jgi:hypothetical protein